MGLIKNLNKWMTAFILVSVIYGIIGILQYLDRDKKQKQIDVLNVDVKALTLKAETREKETVELISTWKKDTKKKDNKIAKLGKRIGELELIPPEKVKIIYRDKIKYVEIPHTEYVKLYDFTLAFKREFPEFIDDGKSADENARGIIDAYKKQTIDFRSYRAKTERRESLYKKLINKRFGFVIGVGATIGMDGNFRLGFFAGYAWIIN